MRQPATGIATRYRRDHSSPSLPQWVLETAALQPERPPRQSRTVAVAVAVVVKEEAAAAGA